MSEFQSLKALIVGCGRIAGGYNQTDRRYVLTHALAWQRLGVSVVGCLDTDAIVARQFAADWDIADHGTDLAAMLDRCQPHIVSLCTPPEHRLGLIEIILAQPSVRSLVLEKPLALTWREAEQICECIARHGVAATVNYFRAADPCYRDIEKALREQRWGACKTAIVHYFGAAWSNPPHLLERLIAIFGPATSVARRLGEGISPAFSVQFGDATAYFLPIAETSYSPFELDLYLERARLRIVDAEERVECHELQEHPRYPGYDALAAASPPFASVAPSPESLLNLLREAALHALPCAKPHNRELLFRAAEVARIMEPLHLAESP